MGINLNRANYSWEHTNAQAISAALRTDQEGADPQEMVVTWLEIAQSFRALAEYLAATVRASIDSHEGEAAEAFRSSTLPLAGFAEECGAQAVEAAHAVHLQAEYLESARSLVPIGQPRPEKGFLDAILPGLTGYADAVDSWDQDNQRARDVMVEYQGNSNGVLGSTLGFDPQARIGELRVAAPPPVTPVSAVFPPGSGVERSSSEVMPPRDERGAWPGGADPVNGDRTRGPGTGGGPSPDSEVEAAPPGGQPSGPIPQPSAAGQAPAVEARWAVREAGGTAWTATHAGVSSGAGPTAGGPGPGPFGVAGHHAGPGMGALPGRGPGPGGSGTATRGPSPGVTGGGTTSPGRPGPTAGGLGAGLGGVPGGSTAGRPADADDTPSHRRADYLVEMDSLFDDDRRVAPPVLDGMNRPHEER